MDTSTKILPLAELKNRLIGHRALGQHIVLANGCFDILHVGHVRYLNAARQEGDILVVAVNSDSSVRPLKGSGRPILPEKARAALVAALASVDYVVIFPEPNVEELLREFHPDVHAKGTDYSVDTVPERNTSKQLAIRVAIVGDPKRHSTRDLFSKIRERPEASHEAGPEAVVEPTGPAATPAPTPASIQATVSPAARDSTHHSKPARRFLLVRLGSLGDIIHTLPASAALRAAFPDARIDWLVESKWRALLEGNHDLNRVIVLDRSRRVSFISVLRELRAAKYTHTIDFQSLYKSAILARAAGAGVTLGFEWDYAREKPAAWLYTRRILPSAAHKVEHNYLLAEAAGAKHQDPVFQLPHSTEAEAWAYNQLRTLGLQKFFVISPGGGWRSKCWPPERYGELHRQLTQKFGIRAIVSFGPGEENLAREVVAAAGDPAPIPLAMDLPQLIAVLRRAELMIAADTGPLHLAAALGTRVVGIYGPTEPARNGPWSDRAIVVRNAKPEETTYKRRAESSPAMLRITVDEAADAATKLLETP
jgi:heptosyltransferase-1